MIINLNKKQITSKVINNIKLSNDIYQITIESPEIAQSATPGQFVSILCEDLVLRRPFSISNTDQDFFQVIYKIKGKGTRYISNLKSGDLIDFIGALGNGFNITNERALLLGAGVGIAPVLFLSKVLEKERIPYFLMAGFQEMIKIDALNPANSCLITEDGSSKFKGRVIDYLKEAVEKHKPEKIYTCGPEPVLKYIVNIANEYNIKTEIALEKKFACGTGVCMGCVVKIKENNTARNKRICKDGPVFEGRSVVWEV